MKLNVGCGLHPLESYVNLDKVAGPGIDCVTDLDYTIQLRYDDDTFDEILMSHILEHLHRPLAVMQELHRVAKPGCLCTIRLPYGSSDNAWEDPTHVRPYFIGSFQYFSQLAYAKADYGYRGDWRIKERRLRVQKDLLKYRDDLEHLFSLVNRGRNFVEEMTVVLEAVKPIRSPNDPVPERSPIQFDFGG